MSAPSDERPDRRTVGWAARCARLCLVTWPRRLRERDGGALLEALEEQLDAPGPAGSGGERPRGARRLAVAVARPRLVLLECASIVAAGLRMRWDVARDSARGATTGWAREAGQAARTCLRSPGFTAAVVTSIALGVGANAAVLSVAHRTLFSPPPYEDPDRLVYVWATRGDGTERYPVAAPDVAAVRERAASLAGVAFVGRAVDGALRTSEAAAALHVRHAAASADLFALLGVEPALGRTFSEGEALAAGGGGTGPVAVVISDGLWTRAFGRDPSVVGSTAWLSGNLGGTYSAEDGAVVVVGVLRPDFRLVMPPSAGVATDVELWVPVRTSLGELQRTDDRRVDRDTDNTGAALARMRPDVTPARASEDVARVAAELRAELPAYDAARFGLVARSLHADATAEARPLLAALAAAAGIVLLVTCLNVSTLLLARGAGRRTEVAVRVALGAGRARILRHLSAEASVLAGLGTLFAVLAGLAVHRTLVAFLPPALAPAGDASLDPRFLTAAGLVAIATTVACALVPAARASGPGPAAGPPRGDTRSDAGRVREALVAVQMALSVVVLLGGALLLRSVHELVAVHPGFVAEGALTFDLSVRAPGRYQGPAERARLMARISTALEELPGVRAVGLTGQLPLSGRSWSQPWGLPGQPESEWAENRADFRTVSSGYFRAVGTRVLEGRPFTASEDVREADRVVVVDEALARRLVPEGSAVGATVAIPLDGRAVEAEVVGVVERVRHESLRAYGPGTVYVPYRQEAGRDVSFVVRAEGDPAALAPRVHETLAAIDAQLPLHGLSSLADHVERGLAPTRFALAVLSGFATLALLCVGIGLYGVVALEAARRTREIGVRMAIGARPRDVLASALGRGLRLVVLGAVPGAVLALGAAEGLDALLYGAGALDPLAWSAVIGIVAAVTLAACWGPAARASRIAPMSALRHD